ncbi:MAG: DDE-type integrase/transposase/recombinase [Gemmatimonadetes bacterium]|nr:DDE-type integrase/transposase/recombinase [Gemmatimonadota bacterium]
MRFETVPGHQAQVDFAHCRLPWGVRYALVVVLGHSRLLWVQFYPRQDLRAQEHSLSACFASWGGVPRELLFDQMRSVLTRDDRLTGAALTISSWRFARHYGAQAKVCPPVPRPDQGQGRAPGALPPRQLPLRPRRS